MQIGGLGTSNTAKLGGASNIQTSAKKTVKNAITDGFVKQIQTLAHDDAEKGIYMDEKFSQLQRARMEQYISPDRAGPMAKVNSVMKTLEKEQERINAGFWCGLGREYLSERRWGLRARLKGHLDKNKLARSISRYDEGEHAYRAKERD